MLGHLARRFLTATAFVCAASAAAAQDFPSRPITLMVGLAPGGITDVTARLYAEAVQRQTGHRFVIENRAGGGGAVGAAAVQNARPDGHTLLVFSGSQHTTVAAASQAGYEPVKGFTPITFLFNSVVALVVPADSPAKTLAELHDLGKKKPGGLSFGTPGLGSPSHLLGAKILLADKVPAETLHYRGGAPTIPDLITGRLDFGWPTLSTARTHLADKKLRALVVDADQRVPMLPDVPTLVELGYAKERVASWFGLAGPAAMPPALVNTLNQMFVKASQDPELKRRLDENGTPINTSTPEQMTRALEQEWVTMQELVRILDLKI